MSKFILDKQYFNLLSMVGINTIEIFRKASLPQALLNKKTPSITSSEYYKLMKVISSVIQDEDTILRIGLAENIHTISPPIYAAYCSKNTCSCIERMAKYKKLIGPLLFEISKTNSTFSVDITSVNEEQLPSFLVELEVIILINIIRRATKENIIPINIITQHDVTNKEVIKFVGIKPSVGNKNILSFSMEDAKMPFVSRNDAMWDYFEPELKRRLSEISEKDSFASKVNHIIMELLPSGEIGIEQVSKELLVSKRTLQRKLGEENTTFQRQLIEARKLMANYYIENTKMCSSDIAYLLGYQDVNSFLRAFHLWTGMSVSEYKRSN